jgi:ATP/maltotriose-dependent transcriptional regulator MalT
VIYLTKKALDLLPQDDFYYRSSLLQNMAMAYISMANLAEAWKNLQQCWNEARASGIPYVAIAAAYMMSRCLQTQGRLDAMDHLLKTALADLQVSESTNGRIIPALGILYIAHAWLLFERGNREKAGTAAVEQELKQGLELCALTAEHYVLAEGFAINARMLAEKGDIHGAHNCLEDMTVNCPESSGFSAAYRIRLMLARNSEDAGIELLAARLPSKLDDRVFPVTTVSNIWHWEEQMGLVRLQIARKRRLPATDLKPVLRYLDQQIETCQSAGWQMQCIELNMIKALALDANGTIPGTLEALAESLTSAEKYGFYRTLVEEGAPLADLLRRTANLLQDSPLLRQLMADLILGASPAPPVQPTHPLLQEHPITGPADLLTGRELEVLQLMAAGFSNKEIAQKLVVTVGTVKTHASNIYRKLDVIGRTKALAKARQLNFL